MTIVEFKKKYDIKKLNYKESIKKAIERLCINEGWAAWHYNEVKLVYNNIIKCIKKNKLNYNNN